MIERHFIRFASRLLILLALGSAAPAIAGCIDTGGTGADAVCVEAIPISERKGTLCDDVSAYIYRIRGWCEVLGGTWFGGGGGIPPGCEGSLEFPQLSGHFRLVPKWHRRCCMAKRVPGLPAAKSRGNRESIRTSLRTGPARFSCASGRQSRARSSRRSSRRGSRGCARRTRRSAVYFAKESK